MTKQTLPELHQMKYLEQLDNPMDLPLISVIIPVYKVEKFLPKCLDSIIGQTYKNLEIILIDDGSTDNSGKICDEYALKDTRIRVVHQKNQGLPLARNAGLKIAHGEYIAFVDSDDYIELDMYEYLWKLISKQNADVAMCNACEDEGFYSQKPIDVPYALGPIQKFFEFSDWMAPWNKLYKRELIGDVRFDPTASTGEDELFNFELAKKNALVALGNQSKYHYRCHQNPNSVTVNFRPSHLNQIILVDKTLAYSKEHNWRVHYKTRRSAQFKHAVLFLTQLARSSEPDDASIDFLTGYIKKHFFKFLFDPYLFLRMKLFGLVCCINFNLARKIAQIYYKNKK